AGPGAVHVGDLGAVRAQLRELGLDWDPPMRTEGKPAPLTPLSRVQVVGAELARDPQALLRAEIDRLTVGLFLNPFDDEAYARCSQIFWQRGWLHYQQKRWADARDDFGRCLALDPNHVEAYH